MLIYFQPPLKSIEHCVFDHRAEIIWSILQIEHVFQSFKCPCTHVTLCYIKTVSLLIPVLLFHISHCTPNDNGDIYTFSVWIEINHHQKSVAQEARAIFVYPFGFFHTHTTLVILVLMPTLYSHIQLQFHSLFVSCDVCKCEIAYQWDKRLLYFKVA